MTAEAPADSAVDEPAREEPTRIRWMIFALASGMSFVLYLHRYTWGMVKPLVGEAEHGHGDASVLVPLVIKHAAVKGVALSNGVCPQYGAYDPYAMAWAAESGQRGKDGRGPICFEAYQKSFQVISFKFFS